MTILVTGSAGHLGEGLMRRLRAQSRSARGLDIKPSAFTDLVGSIADREVVAEAMRGVRCVIHSATLHKPHVATHSYRQFVDTNIAGTLALLEAAVAEGVECFIFTSTTSAFGAALTPRPGEPATWITEQVAPIPKNIYGTTKIAAEGLCELFQRKHGLPVLVLRTSRFFPEDDDDAAVRSRFDSANMQANELLYRRADIDDVVQAHLCAIERAPALGFGRYIVSATTPFAPEDLAELSRDAAMVVERLFPHCRELYAAKGWALLPQLDRVYVNQAARRDLHWEPRFGFGYVLDCLRAGLDFRSELAHQVGIKGYHAQRFQDMPYPVS
ncbi:NAD-dependent epimerase/dehydratase family protein [Pseudomonas sp. CGJS7]|uniref:NAD-dependent epimerase/dehydratase family protein n=1 Tax=Pseudomonas sp. CGJS7 TaxID=3109348 RepID=UPI00300A5C3A